MQRWINGGLVGFGVAATVFLALIIAVLTLAPISPGGPAGFDKIYHSLAFAALAFPLSFVRPRMAPWIILGVIVYGGTIELIQPFFLRHAEWGDLGADAGGSLLGAAVGYFTSSRIFS